MCSSDLRKFAELFGRAQGISGVAAEAPPEAPQHAEEYRKEQPQCHAACGERRGLQSLSSGNEPFVTKALAYAEANAGLVPPYLNVPEFRKDYNLALALQAILQVSSPMQSSIEDTAAAAGHGEHGESVDECGEHVMTHEDSFLERESDSG